MAFLCVHFHIAHSMIVMFPILMQFQIGSYLYLLLGLSIFGYISHCIPFLFVIPYNYITSEHFLLDFSSDVSYNVIVVQIWTNKIEKVVEKMSVKVAGFLRLKGEISKSTGNPYDLVKFYLLSDENDKVCGYEPINVFINTANLQNAIGIPFEELSGIINEKVRLDVGMVNGSCRITGFSVIPKEGK